MVAAPGPAHPRRDIGPDLIAGRLAGPLTRWYAAHARDLPWRAPDATPWGVLVSEVMLQQTPVARVLPVWTRWLARWPDPAALAGSPAGAAIREWDRLGYPRRALRLHQAATAITERHDGNVPASYPDLLALPGIGTYTAAAVASFAFGARHAVVDTNVRRVQARLVTGAALPAPAVTSAELRLAEELLPARRRDVARWNVAVMELGALVCTARAPRCPTCPVRQQCAWQLAGAPPYDGKPHPVQPWQGTDRQMRGRLVAALRATVQPLSRPDLLAAGQPATSAGADRADRLAQADRCLAALVEEGLVEVVELGGLVDGRGYRLPG